MSESELFDVVDGQGNPTGETVIRRAAHEKGILHRPAHVWVIRRNGNRTDLLLQRRSAEKDSWPLCLDTSVAGHILAGDEPKESALRELEEELGIRAEANELREAGTFRIRFQERFHDRMFNDNEIAFLYVYEKPVRIADLKLQEEEVSEAVWMDIDEAAARIENGDPEICADLKSVRLLETYIRTNAG
jgi:isopentenyldiphosphate isomerase